MEHSKQNIFRLPKIIDDRGNLSFIEELNHVPFGISRAYWIYDVPGGEFRGSHAYREQEEFIVALSGSFDVVLENEMGTVLHSLNRSYMGVYVPKMTWRRLENFSTNSLCLILASHTFCEEDYIREYDAYIAYLKENKENSVCVERNVFPLSPIHPSPATVYDCGVFELPKVHDRRGNLTAVNNRLDIPFDMKRVFYIYDIPSGATRGAHAHKEAWQFIVAASSSFDILLDDGHNRRMVHLDRPNYGLLVPPGIWSCLQNFSSAAVCMVLTSHLYDPDDYLRDYDEFLAFRSCR